MSTLFRVEAEGMNGSIFVYTVEGPDSATDMDATCEVYGMHGRLLRDGLVQEPLGPFNTVTRTPLS